VDDYVDISVALPIPCTIECWVNPDNIGNIMGIIDGIGDANLDYYINTAGYPYFYTNNIDGSRNSIQSSVSIKPNAWSHLTIVLSESGRMIYVDGTLTASDGMISKSLNIANIGKCASYYWDGLITEVEL